MRKHLLWIIPLIGVLTAAVAWSLREPRVEATSVADASMDRRAGRTADVVYLTAEAIGQGEIEIVQIRPQALHQFIEATGRLKINEDQSARVGSPVEGRVTRVLVTVGDSVREGQPLLYIHSHELIDARAAYTKAVANRARADKALNYARAESERATRLLNARAISVREQLLADANLSAAEAESKAAEAELERSKEFIEHLGVETNAEEIPVRAPISGIVLQRNITTGTVVQPSSDLMILSNLSTLWVVADVPERQAGSVRAQQKVSVRVAAFEREFDGRVVYLGESLDPQTRTVQVRSVIRNDTRRLYPEMYANVRIEQAAAGPVLAVPSEALHEIEGQPVVFVELQPGVYERRSVLPGVTTGGFTEIRVGIASGERVVAKGSFAVKTEFLRGTLSEQ